MKKYFILLIAFLGCSAPGERPDESTLAPGYPDRSDALDVLPGFQNPPAGYGEVPFWWWTGDSLDPARMKAQLGKLHEKGISGVQVNYSHYDTPGWLTDNEYQQIFSERWWNVYADISRECSNLGMGIGLSTYTIDWPQGSENLFYRLFYHKKELNAMEIRQGLNKRVKGGTRVSLRLTSEPVDFSAGSWADADKIHQVIPERISVHAYPVIKNKIQKGGISLDEFISSGTLNWTPPQGEWEIREFLSVRKPGSFNPLMQGAGDTIVNGFFSRFEERAGSSRGLNYFFNDELTVGTGKHGWNPDFAEEFRKIKGYDLIECLPALWEDIGDITAKIKMDYADVRMSLMEERYFKPIYKWHHDRGMIYGCDSGGRGLDPSEFGDYFRATRWYTAPGHDTPGGKADPMKGKVSSSIANLYQQPRVWLEGYHSLGWGAAPELLMYATRENYLYGCTLLNLHGLYYSTYGSYWEWAPPCYHFRMPYWAHMDAFLDYFERLSYLLSQGHLVCDVAVVYPVAPYEAELNGKEATQVAFELGRKLLKAGINFEFIDNESLAEAVIEDSLLKVKRAGAAYKAIIFPGMEAVRWQTIEKAAGFAGAGGKVYVLGKMPSASDHAGSNDQDLEKLVETAFKPERRMKTADETVDAVRNAFVQDVSGKGRTVRSLHRKAGFRDVYMVMDAVPGTVAEFRAKGSAELWDPWTGSVTPLKVTGETATGTLVELPLEEYEAAIVAFTPGKKQVNPKENNALTVREILLPDEWNVSFVPTMDNTYGDFRLPVTEDNKMIGIEGRRFTWARENNLSSSVSQPGYDDSQWAKKLYGYGTQFYILGPIPPGINTAALESALSQMKKVNPSVPVSAGGSSFIWQPYDFSWRYGREGDQGHQGYHGLKKTVTDDFLCLGKPEPGLNETRYVEEVKGGKYYVWTTITMEEADSIELVSSSKRPADNSNTSDLLIPSKTYLNGKPVSNTDFKLPSGTNMLLVRYDRAGRGHLVVRRHGPRITARKTPLSMSWFDDSRVIPFDVYAGEKAAEWFRFISAPGTTGISFKTEGTSEAWIDGVPMKKQGDRFVADSPAERSSVIALRIEPSRSGITGGMLIPEPVKVETSEGKMKLGDWSGSGILNNYSGGARYSTRVMLEKADAGKKVVLDLGKVAGTAEVSVNGRKAGVRVAPPWRTDLSGYLGKGENTISVLIYNTLANHYQTVPSRYKGNPVSGLIGPVRLLIYDKN